MEKQSLHLTRKEEDRQIMWFVMGWIVNVVTFPGVIVHEIAHQLFCRLFRVAVIDVCYFRFGNPAGYVRHERPARASQNIVIGVGPFFVNSIVGAVIAFPAFIPVEFESPSPLHSFLLWLGVSIAMHAFPSTGDARSIWKAVWSTGVSNWTRFVATPIVILIYLGAIGSVFWLDLVYGVVVTSFFPLLLHQLLGGNV